MIRKNMTYYTESYKTAFLASLFIIGAVTIYKWFVIPHKNYLEAAQRYDSTVSALNSKKQIVSNNLKTIKVKYNKLQEQYSVMQEKLFDAHEEREFFSNVEILCQQAGCKMISLISSQSSVDSSKPAKESKDTGYVALSPASLIVKGKYANIVSFMNKLQGGVKLVRISPVSINNDTENPGYLICNMTITIYVTNEKKVF